MHDFAPTIGNFMTSFVPRQAFLNVWSALFALIIVSLGLTVPAHAQVTAFKQAVAEAASGDIEIAEFYRTRSYDPIWTGRAGRDAQRRRAFLSALENAGDHALPVRRYDPTEIRAALRAANTPRARGQLEVDLSRKFLQYARDIQTGILVPSRVDEGIVRVVPRVNRLTLLRTLASRSPNGVFRALTPKTPEYNRLMAEKLRFERLLGRGGWGPDVAARKLEPGDSGNLVVILRNRLIAMGYMRRSATQTYDAAIQQAVQQFQLAHGLTPDGVAGQATIQQLNVGVENRLQSVIVAMERERWLNRDRGDRHVLVNLTDFTAKIVDNGRVTFSTRSVVGKNQSDRRSPEFSDVMEHMVINPTWNVPRSIATEEYLPLLQRDPNAAGHMRITDVRGQLVDRASIDFTQFDTHNFPFDIKQPPSRRNALGLVKFMFPNPHNIYLHDTPAKNLFAREVRDFSHGCIRLNDPFDFAYALLARQVSNPEAFFQERLATGRETVVPLEVPIQVHLIYRTAFTQARGRTQFRRDIYGRDRRIWNALSQAGVALRAVRS
jgi:L,D-transpeptidase YcbB